MSTPQILSSPEEILSAARYAACFQLQPYLSVAVQSMIPVWKKDFGSIAVSEHMHLIIDPDKWVEWYTTHGINTCAWILIHEVGHILRDHCVRARRMGITEDTAHLANACQDAEINDDIPDARNNLPEGYCWLPSDLGQATGLMWEEYYAALPIDPPSGKRGIPKGGKGGKGGKGDPGTPQGGGQCGSGATGVPVPAEDGLKGPGTGADSGKDPSNKGGAEGSGQGSDAGDGLEDVAGRGSAEIQRIRNQVAADITAAANGPGRGNVPAGLQRWAAQHSRPPVIPWRQLLAKVTRGSVGIAAGQKDYTYRRVSRRQAGSGYGCGVPILPRMFSPTPRILIAVDTSGSMSNEGLSAALSEVGGVISTSNADITVVSCDCELHTARRVRNLKDAAAALKGGGGTDFRPVFEHVEKLRRNERPDVVLFFTDGDGPAPVDPPKGIDVIWILVDGHAKACIPYSEKGGRVTYGRIVRVPPIVGGVDSPLPGDSND